MKCWGCRLLGDFLIPEMFAHLLMAKSDYRINDGKAAFLLCVWHSQVSRYLVHIRTLEGV